MGLLQSSLSIQCRTLSCRKEGCVTLLEAHYGKKRKEYLIEKNCLSRPPTDEKEYEHTGHWAQAPSDNVLSVS